MINVRKIDIAVFWYVTLHNLIQIWRLVREVFCLHHQS